MAGRVDQLNSRNTIRGLSRATTISTLVGGLLLGVGGTTLYFSNQQRNAPHVVDLRDGGNTIADNVMCKYTTEHYRSDESDPTGSGIVNGRVNSFTSKSDEQLRSTYNRYQEALLSDVGR